MGPGNHVVFLWVIQLESHSSLRWIWSLPGTDLAPYVLYAGAGSVVFAICYQAYSEPGPRLGKNLLQVLGGGWIVSDYHC